MKRSVIASTAAKVAASVLKPGVLAIAAMLALAAVAGDVASPASAADPVVVNLFQCLNGGGTTTVPAGIPVQLKLPGYAQGTRGLITDFLLKERTSLTLDSYGTSTVTDLTGSWSTPQQLDTHLWATREPNFDLGSLTSRQTVTVTWAVTFAQPLLVAFPPVGPSGDNGPYLINGEGPISCQITT